jgi:hypothetical protein
MIDLMAGYKNGFSTLNTRGGLFSTLKTRSGLFYTYFFCCWYVNPLNMGFNLNLDWGPLQYYDINKGYNDEMQPIPTENHKMKSTTYML